MKMFLLLFTIISCSIVSQQSDKILKNNNHLSQKTKIENVPFIQQSENHCGPASLAMILRHLNKNVTVEELVDEMYTPEKKGSFQTDVISSARRQGMMAIPIYGVDSLLKEIENGNPVLIFQNVGFEFFPRWHYSVAIGYDLNGPDIFLHTGNDKDSRTDLRVFERSWALAHYWGLVVLQPGQISITANELDHVMAASGLEQVGKKEESIKAYKSILEKWPKSLGALIGMGNIMYKNKKLRESIEYLEKATYYHPNSSIAWHNLATAQGSRGLKKQARKSSLMAINYADQENISAYRESLFKWLQ